MRPIDLVKKWLSEPWPRYGTTKPEPVPPPPHPCLHGNEHADCEVKCSGCGHDCGAHGNACRAAWASLDPNPVAAFGPNFIQHFCSCRKFEP